MSGVPLVDAGPELIEREQVCAVLDALVDRLRDGGGTVVVRGEAGIGKSVLLQRVRRRAEAQGARPLFTVGVESEAELPFAGLNQLLRPVIGALAQLPESQRQTLEAALGLGVDLKPDSFRVAVAVYSHTGPPTKLCLFELPGSVQVDHEFNRPPNQSRPIKEVCQTTPR